MFFHRSSRFTRFTWAYTGPTHRCVTSSSYCIRSVTSTLSFTPHRRPFVRTITHSNARGSNNNSSNDNNDNTESKSRRAAFQALPVVPSVLSYIEKIGVGIRSKPSNIRKRLQRSRQNNVDFGESPDLLSALEEKDYFSSRERQRRFAVKRSNLPLSTNSRRSSNTTNANAKKAARIRGALESSPKDNRSLSMPHSKSFNGDGRRTAAVPAATDDISASKVNEAAAYWLPPPPFSSFSKSLTHERTEEDRKGIDRLTSECSGLQIIRRPVKLLGKAGSLKDTIPFESKGLSEVALAGRSNVGKSTLLNALLYGNIDESLSPRMFERGKTPMGAKLPKGIKAVTSDIPGETKEITFYQLTADVIVKKFSNHDNPTTVDKPCNDKDSVSKMSLLLVDLPGYGFAFAKDESSREWQELMHHYLLERKSLKRILLLLDARHGFKKTDLEFLSSLQEGLVKKNLEGKVRKRELPPIQIVLTKCDLVKQTDLARRTLLVRRELSDFLNREPSNLPVMLVSAKPGLGFNNIRNGQPLGGLLELQRELAALVPVPRAQTKSNAG